MKIKAAVAKRPGTDLVFEELSLGELRPDEVLVQIVATGICHTDLFALKGQLATPFPCVLGHEGAGRVVSVGSDVSDLASGMSVVLSFASCGHCRNCDSGERAYCERFAELNYGGSRADGTRTLRDRAGQEVNGSFFGQSSFASHTVVARRNVVEVKTELPLELIAPLGCGFQTGVGTIINVLRPSVDDAVAIFGAGAVGLAGLLAAKILGCKTIIAIDRVATRLALATSLGATHVIDTATENLAERLESLGGIACVVETTGVPVLIEAAVAALQTKGRVALLGQSGNTELTIDYRRLFGGRQIRGVRMGDSNPQHLIPMMIEWIERGDFPIDRLIRYYPHEEINQAIADATSGDAIKPVLRLA